MARCFSQQDYSGLGSKLVHLLEIYWTREEAYLPSIYIAIPDFPGNSDHPPVIPYFPAKFEFLAACINGDWSLTAHLCKNIHDAPGPPHMFIVLVDIDGK